MALGIENNTIAPGLIERSGRFLSENIRSIGQQVQGHIAEIQTRRDLASMAQQIQGLNVQSNDFPAQLVGLAVQHPMATSDPRGQMALKVLANANENWMQSQNRISSMYGTLPGGGIYDRRTGNVTREPDVKPVSVGPNSRLVDPVTGDVIVEPAPLPEKPFNLAPGARRYDAQGNVIAENPKPAATMTEYQRRSLASRERKERREGLKARVDAWEKDLASLERQITERRKADAMSPEVTEWQKRFETTKELRDAAVAEIAGLEADVEPELGSVPADAAAPVPQGDGGILPAPGAVAAPASNSEFVLVFDPNGRPGRIRASQLESALANGYRRR